MRKIIYFYMAFLVVLNAAAQIKNPVKWQTKTEKISETEFNLILNGSIDDGWHVYSQFTPDLGPLPMTLEFKNQKGNYDLIGKAKESPYKKHFNDIFGVDEYYFEKTVMVTQKIKITNPKNAKVNLHFEYQTCKDQCINDQKDFVFELPKVDETASKIEDTTKKTVEKIDTIQKTETPKIAVVSADVNPKPEEKKSLLGIFIAALFAGFTALLTPCVYPMIPMTVSFFTKQSKNKSQGKRNAIIFGLSIILIYIILGSIITAIFGADALNSFSTGVWFNVIFFILLVVFAISFLGAFEIMLPNSWANKVDKQADKGGIIGILFMALALAIISFSCTGPFVGNILFASASVGGIGPIIGMLGFSLAFALPFVLFAFFPAWLQSLPKSGGWMNTVKVSLGFLELAFAFKFLSNADLVLQLHWFEREVFLAIWIAIFGAWGLYLLGKIILPHDSPISHISVGRLLLALLVFSFTFYMIPGLWGAPLKLISAFPPPEEYSESPNGLGGSAGFISNEKLPDGATLNKHGLILFTDYEKGLAYAKEKNKPILLDFTGHACVNCRKMENNVWTDDKVASILKNDVVVISLFADDKRDLPANEQLTSKATGSKIVTIGDKWTDLMISKYKTNTQPLYVLEDLQGNNLNTITPTTSYNPDVKFFENWLQQGISNFKN